MPRRGFLATAALLAVLAGTPRLVAAAGPDDALDAPAGGIHAGALWDIVSTCIDRQRPAQQRACECPAFVHSCCRDRATPNDAVVWAEAPHFVAIRDMKMCGCEGDFVAGLALPRARVTGIEDPSRPEGIWPFAWSVARDRIRDELEIGLVINPIQARSQNQMHVHMLRLKPGVRAELEAALASGAWPASPGTIVVRLANLDNVFADAVTRVGAAQIGDHGILVARGREGAFLAAITDRRSPQLMTVSSCR